MNIRKLFSAVVIAAVLIAAVFLLAPQPAYAACGLPVGVPCPPGGGGKKKPTPTVLPRSTPTSTSTPTPVPSDTATPQAVVPLPNPQQPSGVNPPPVPTLAPSSVSSSSPGPLLMIIAVLIIIVCFGLIIVVRNLRNRGGTAFGGDGGLVNPWGTPDPGTRFDKTSPLDGELSGSGGRFDKDFEFRKAWDSGPESQFHKNWQSDQDARFGKVIPGETGPSNGSTPFTKIISNGTGSPVADDLNPQPLPPKTIQGSVGGNAAADDLNPQPLPPKSDIGGMLDGSA